MRIEKQSVKLQTPAQLIDDRIFVPLRDVSEAFDTQVSWQEPNTVIVGDNAHVLTLENPDVMNLINLNLN